MKIKALSQKFPTKKIEIVNYGTFVPRNFRSLELSFPGTFVPWNFRSHDWY